MLVVDFGGYFCLLTVREDRNTEAGKPLVTVRDVAVDHWRRFGRHYYTRYDYEGLETQQAQMVMTRLLDIVAKFDGKTPLTVKKVTLVRMDEFEYHDPIDGSVSAHQGIRFFAEDESCSDSRERDLPEPPSACTWRSMRRTPRSSSCAQP